MSRRRLFTAPLLVLAVGLAVVWLQPKKSQEELLPSTSVPPKVSTPPPEKLEEILERDPMRFLEMSLDKYDKTITGYVCTFNKQERIKGELKEPERCEVRFREAPFSVFMTWERTEKQPVFAIGKLTRPAKVLYSAGENDGKLVARANVPFVPLQIRDVDGPEAKNSGRFTIAQFGFKKSTERTLRSMKEAASRGRLFVRYEGIVPVEKLGGQKCYKFVRTPYDPPPAEEDQLNTLTVYYDLDHWLQVGAELRDVEGRLLGEYYFTDIQINPGFSEKQFTREAL